MDNYGAFALVYDLFMDNIPYDEWIKYIVQLLKKYGIDSGTIVELGCGTGNITNKLSELAYDMIGIDYSEDMLSLASNKAYESNQNILYLCQDMREFNINQRVDAIISVCDCINYILEEGELLQTFKLVEKQLDDKGVFIFDLNTKYYYEMILGNSTIADNKELASFICENTFYEDEDINGMDLTLFIKENNNNYKKYEEEHYRRAYKVDVIINLLSKANLQVINIFDAFTEEDYNETSERIYIIARKKANDL